MDIAETRRDNLKKWFAGKKLPEKEKSYLSQLMGGKASFGEKAARRLEASYGMPDHYLDSDHTEETPVAGGPADYPALNGLSLQDWNYLLPSERARLVDQIKEMAAHNRAVMQELAKYEKQPAADEQTPIEAGRVVRVSDRRKKQVTFSFPPRRATDKKSGGQP